MPRPDGDEGLHCVVVVAAEGEAWLEAGRPAAVENDGSIGAVRSAADPGRIGDFFEGDRASAHQRVAIGHDEIEGVLQQVGPLQFNVWLGQRLMLVDEGEIQLPTCEPWDQPLAMVVEHGQVDVGVALGEDRDGAGDQGLDGGGEAGEPQPAPAQAGDLAQFLLRLFQACEHRLGVGQEGMAGVGEP